MAIRNIRVATGRLKIVISCIFSYSLRRQKAFDKYIKELLPLPEYITAKGPYINRVARAGFRAVVIYEFEESRFAEASKNILNQIGGFHSVSGLACSTQVWTEAGEALKYARFAFKSKESFGEAGR